MMQQAFLHQSKRPIAGIDEAGRGSLAGPVVAAAVILDRKSPIDGLRDSKELSVGRRFELASEIRQHSLAWSVAWADPAEIDHLNILEATFLAMRRAILGLHIKPHYVQIDGNHLPNLTFGTDRIRGEAIIRGDATKVVISAASIIAKVCRDEIMIKLDGIYPNYGFARHKGYATVDHRKRIDRFGACQQHRRSFHPLRSMNFY
ncbi:ribonuclease HII [Woeseiaceae bacterium]|jgi:ribonuclease HII|nr:ribonuclease HII [Woeseiaceae bacterium]